MVIKSLFFVSLKLLEHIHACAHVTETPDLSKIIVFIRGILRGLNLSILRGGQSIPISWLGANLWWKKLQKNLMKNKISEVMNNIIPYFIEWTTDRVWSPWKVLSRWTSRHQVNMIHEIRIRFIVIGIIDLVLKNITEKEV